MKEEPLMSGTLADHSLAASVYSSENGKRNNQPPQSPAMEPMTATELLQKASQMGFAKSGRLSLFGNTVGVVQPSSSPSSGSTNNQSFGPPVSRSELHQVLGPAALEVCNDGKIGRGLVEQIGRSLHGAEFGCLTRDFLGVDGGESCCGGGRFSPQDVATFESITSAMGLGGGHFTGNH